MDGEDKKPVPAGMGGWLVIAKPWPGMIRGIWGDDERFAAQYFRANTRGSERYVQTVPGSTEARLRPGESGFDNLWLAGDWVRSGMNAGCVEGAAMGGLGAASAISRSCVA